MNGDGADDLVFLQPHKLAVKAVSAKDLSETFEKEEILGLDTSKVRQAWLVPNFPDLDGDGLDECLIGVRSDAGAEWVFASGKDFRVIKRVPVTGELAWGIAHLYGAGDLNGDGVVDLIITKNCGAKADKDVSYLGALSGADGSELWQIAGNSLPGGPKRFAVDAKTGERRDLPGDVGFGGRPEILVDLDGDAAREIACALPTIVGGERTQGVLIFSGATGAHLTTLALPSSQGRLLGEQMLLIPRFDPAGAPVLAVSGQAPDKKYVVAVFDLPKIKR
ncbi:MAG: VCBS repeat-containing protein [Planctomycetota bacterium]